MTKVYDLNDPLNPASFAILVCSGRSRAATDAPIPLGLHARFREGTDW